MNESHQPKGGQSEVRVRYNCCDPFTEGEDVLVEQLVDGEWVVKRRFNSLSNDMAYVNAEEAARELRRKKS